MRFKTLAIGVTALGAFAFGLAAAPAAAADPVQPPYNCDSYLSGWPVRDSGYALCRAGVGDVRVLVYCENGARTTTVTGPWVRAGGTVATYKYSYGYCPSSYPYAYGTDYQTRAG